MSAQQFTPVRGLAAQSATAFDPLELSLGSDFFGDAPAYFVRENLDAALLAPACPPFSGLFHTSAFTSPVAHFC